MRVGFVLVSAEVDGLTAVVGETVGQGFAEGVDNLPGVLGLGVVLGDDMHAHGVFSFVQLGGWG
jgi:predicted flap endonuclease-1-like 5' DNA nuclease